MVEPMESEEGSYMDLPDDNLCKYNLCNYLVLYILLITFPFIVNLCFLPFYKYQQRVRNQL